MSSLPGCYPTWQPHTTYATSTIVSLKTLTNATLSTHKTFNYKCRESPLDQYCGQIGYQPGKDGEVGAWNLVWTNLGECSGNAVVSAPTASPSLSLWSGGGCPENYVYGVLYEGGGKALGEDGNVYECKPFPYNGSCGQKGFEPGSPTSRWSEAWILLGSCIGTISPTSSPNYNVPVYGGCPEPYSTSAVYEEGDTVSADGLAFRCKVFPYSAWCSHESYAPLSVNGNEAWDMLGSCDGTMSPTSSPAFDSLVDVMGCPGVYDANGGDYGGGDRVTLVIEVGRGVVYKCAEEWPDSGYCNIIPPGHDSQLGWTLQGSCSGTIAPSTSPVFVSLQDTAGCPNEYSSSLTYEPGDRVAVFIDSDRAVVWECNQYPIGPYCNQFSPIHETQTGWRMIGSCSGTIAPTSSPNYVSLEIGDGCPEEYSESNAYEIGDVVMAVASQNPLRQMIFECKSPYCNAGSNYGPASENADLGWTLKGHCTGTIAPTSSPAVYSGTCKYNNGTALVDILAWNKSDLTTYKAGTRVRKGTNVYQCKGYPFHLWCKMIIYEPEKGDLWKDCWMPFGTC